MQSPWALGALAFRLVAVWLLFCRLGAAESSMRGSSSFGVAPASRLHQRGRQTNAIDALVLLDNSTEATSSARRRLDVVIAHYSVTNVKKMVEFWLKFLAIPKIAALDPQVFIYCQNPDLSDVTDLLFAPLLERGEMIHMNNMGREGRVYLHHIINHYDDLADHTVFSQDIPDGNNLMGRTQFFFENKTGLLSLAYIWKTVCDDGGAFIPTVEMVSMYALTQGSFCPPEGFGGFYNGEFLVSAKRVRARPLDMYQKILALLEAPNGHWIHALSGEEENKDQTAPMFGHVLERSWSLIFDCTALWRADSCQRCDQSNWNPHACGGEDCQCLDW